MTIEGNTNTMERKYYENTEKKTIAQIVLEILKEQYDNMTPFAKEMYRRHGIDAERTSDIEKFEIYKDGVPGSYRITELPMADTRGAMPCVCFYDVEGVEDPHENLNCNRAHVAWIQFSRQGSFMNLLRHVNWNSIII